MTKHLNVQARKLVWELYHKNKSDGSRRSFLDVSKELEIPVGQVRTAVSKAQKREGLDDKLLRHFTSSSSS